MSTLDKLRALHMEVCRVWRRNAEIGVSEAEAEILNLGFLLLESFAERAASGQRFYDVCGGPERLKLSEYLQRVHSQFDSDADIKITEVPHNE